MKKKPTPRLTHAEFNRMRRKIARLERMLQHAREDLQLLQTAIELREELRALPTEEAKCAHLMSLA
jgi:hypothetical protein